MPAAVDTNVLVQFLVDDGSKEVSAARRVFDRGAVFIPASVMLESEWVLRSVFRVDRDTIREAFSRVLALASVEVEDAEVVSRAVDAHRAGMDFADALHVLTAAHCQELYTFDGDFRRIAKRLESSIPVVEPAPA